MEFLDAHGIPKGPLMLRDIGLSRDQFIAGSHEVHKLKQINHILEVFQELSFILIGDSGQKDPQIYFEVVKTHPGRVLAVYIRDVSGSDLTDLIAEYLIQGVELILVKDTTAAAAHALSKDGFCQVIRKKSKIRESRMRRNRFRIASSILLFKEGLK